ncbi:MAG TPA: Xaa-Pro peptidase family protein [Candidatus Acidoferrum sp.]
MSGFFKRVEAARLATAALRWTAFAFLVTCAFLPAQAQQRREREPNSVYTQRRAKLAASVDAPIVLMGYSGREEESETYIFAQEENFYYLTGHNEEDAALIILPLNAGAKKDDWQGGREILFLPAKDPRKERWNGVRMSPSDPGIEARTGFASVDARPELRATVERLAKVFSSFYTVLPYQKEMGGYPHEREALEWLKMAATTATVKDVRANITDLRVIKAPTEIAFIRQAVDLSVAAHIEAFKMTKPGLWEYQVAAKMVETHAMGGSEAEAYAPIVGAGPNSTALHYDKLSRKMEDGDIVVMDVGAQYSGYASDITRTIPANGKFTPRQKEIYDIVLGAQNAALAAVRPGATFYCRGTKNSLQNIAYDYINSHGKDRNGKSLGQYFIHGLGHHVGLNVHDPSGDPCRPLASGMVITIEPGIYIPEENLGVRIEDDVLVTEEGHEVLSQKLPRETAEIEKIMAEGAKQRATESNK